MLLQLLTDVPREPQAKCGKLWHRLSLLKWQAHFICNVSSILDKGDVHNRIAQLVVVTLTLNTAGSDVIKYLISFQGVPRHMVPTNIKARTFLYSLRSTVVLFRAMVNTLGQTIAMYRNMMYVYAYISCIP